MGHIERAMRDFNDRPSFDTATEIVRWLMIYYADDDPVVSNDMIRSTCEAIGEWLRKLDSGRYPSVAEGQANFRAMPSANTAAGYMFSLSLRATKREEVETALFEIYHWLAYSSHVTDYSRNK